ncbi:MAG: ABC transporter ATP-binding protein [Clostridia bacterium]|nr:ABC transporter ATP-binding protein [Clostridia bacterium]
MELLKITDLQKSFGSKKVLQGVNLTVPEHSILGFIGRNGAGKTTTMKAILGLQRIDGGSITVAGHEVVFGETKTNRFIGYLPDVPEFYPFMTPREYLRLCGESLGMSRSEIVRQSRELLELVGLSAEDRQIKGFSRGMKQRLGVAQALLGEPKLLICDEPTSALDPLGRRELLDVLYGVRERTTVLFSTHILSDVERICTHVAFLHDGKIAIQGTAEELKSLFIREEFVVESADPKCLRMLTEQFPNAKQTAIDSLLFAGGREEMGTLFGFLAEHGLSVQRVERVEPSLESLFMEVISQ